MQRDRFTSEWLLWTGSFNGLNQSDQWTHWILRAVSESTSDLLTKLQVIFSKLTFVYWRFVKQIGLSLRTHGVVKGKKKKKKPVINQACILILMYLLYSIYISIYAWLFVELNPRNGLAIQLQLFSIESLWITVTSLAN